MTPGRGTPGHDTTSMIFYHQGRAMQFSGSLQRNGPDINMQV